MVVLDLIRLSLHELPVPELLPMLPNAVRQLPPNMVAMGWSHFSLQAWFVEMAAFVKSLDPNHLLSTGAEGFYDGSGPDVSANPATAVNTLDGYATACSVFKQAPKAMRSSLKRPIWSRYMCLARE